MTDATLPTLSSPPPDTISPSSSMDYTSEEAALGPVSRMAGALKSTTSSVAGDPFSDIPDPQLLKRHGLDMLKLPEVEKLKGVPHSNDLDAPTAGVLNAAFNLSSQIMDEDSSLKSPLHSQVNLCSNERISAKISAESVLAPHINSISSAEINHVQEPDPKHGTSSHSAVVDLDLLDKLLEPAKQLPATFEAKDDPLSIDSAAFAKSSSNLSCDEASSKDSLLTLTESKSMSSSPEAGQIASVASDMKELSGSHKSDFQLDCNKPLVSSISAADSGVKSFVNVHDEADSGCPSDFGVPLQNASSDELNSDRMPPNDKQGMHTHSGPFNSAALDTVSNSDASNSTTSSTSFNLGISVSISDKTDGSGEVSAERIPNVKALIAGTCLDVDQNAKMQEEEEETGLHKSSKSSALGLEIVQSSLVCCSFKDPILKKSSSESNVSHPVAESSGEKLVCEMDKAEFRVKSDVSSSNPARSIASETPIEVGDTDASTLEGKSVEVTISARVKKEVEHDIRVKFGSLSETFSSEAKSDFVKTRDTPVQESDMESITKRGTMEIDAENKDVGNQSEESNKLSSIEIHTHSIDQDDVAKSAGCDTENCDNSMRACVSRSTSKCSTNPVATVTEDVVSKDSKPACAMKTLACASTGIEIKSPDKIAASGETLHCGGSSLIVESDVLVKSFKFDGEVEGSEQIDSLRKKGSNDPVRIHELLNNSVPPQGDPVNDIPKSSCIVGGTSVIDYETSSATDPETEKIVEKFTLEDVAGKSKSEGEEVKKYELKAPGKIDSSQFPGKAIESAKQIENKTEVTSGKDASENAVPVFKIAPNFSNAKTTTTVTEETSDRLKFENSVNIKDECCSLDAADINMDQKLVPVKHSKPVSQDRLDANSTKANADEVSLPSSSDAESAKKITSISETCEAGDVVLQTVVGGVLQTLDVAALEARRKEEEDSDHRKLFAGVEDELGIAGDILSRNTALHVLENNAEETDGIGGLVINSVVGAFGEGVDELADGESATEADDSNKELMDISSSYQAVNKTTDSQQPECEGLPRSKRPRLESAEPEIRRPVVLRVKPVKGKSEPFWDSSKLRSALAVKGTVLLRLCTSEPTDEFDTPADFVGVMLECCEDTEYGSHAGERNGGLEVYSVGLDGSYHPGVYNHYDYHPRTPAGADEDFVETEEVEESMDYDGATRALDWQGSDWPAEPPSTGVTHHDVGGEDDSHEITYHDEALHDTQPDYAGHNDYFESEIEEKERQYEEHKHLVEQQRNAPIRMPNRICPECNKGFNKRNQFQKHLKTHRPLLKCRYCPFKSRSKKLHKSHEARHRKDDPQYACDKCPMKFVEISQLRGHMSRQHGIFYCPRCCHQSASFDERNEHMMAEHGVQIKRKLGMYVLRECDDDDNADEENICSMCFKKCRSRALLRIHVAQHYNVDPSQLSDGLEPIEKRDPAVSEAYFDGTSEDSQDCKVEYTPPSRSSKKRLHESTEDLHTDNKVPRVADEERDSLKRYINDPEVNVLARIRPASENAIYRCADCNIDLPNPTALFMHVVVTHGFLEYDARRRAREAQNHTPQSSPGVSELQNDALNKELVASSTSGTAYRQFIPYFCRICGPETKFSKYGIYIAHMKTHRKIRKCPECNFQSRLATRVLIHQMNAHKRMFRCPRKCLELFTTKEQMDIHKSEVDCKNDTH